MNDLDARLKDCFSTVFPNLSVDEIVDSSAENIVQWDSMRTVTLVTVIEEEFGVQIPIEQLEKMISFKEILGVVRQQIDNR